MALLRRGNKLTQRYDAAAMQMIPGVDLALRRTPEILSDGTYLILTSPNSAAGEC